MTQMVKIAPSILAADFARLADAVSAAEAGGADLIHIDVMDGHFVPNLSVGPVVVRAVRAVTRLPLDVHLMISEPARYVDAFAEAGADRLTIHIEADAHCHRTLSYIHSLGLKAGISLNPGTPAHSIQEVIGLLDNVLVMTVNPGFGGQHFIQGTLAKIAELRRMLDGAGSAADLEVDGGIDVQTAPAVVSAGANVLVAGTAVFRHPGGIQNAIANLRQAAAENRS